MCGIFGMCLYDHRIEVKTLIDLILNGLRRLEYRGYDSAGFCIGRVPLILKAKGNVNALVKALENVSIDYGVYDKNHIGIAHTRWATHGPPSDVNAHPHTSDPSHTFVVVHNGIIQNYDSLRKMLEEMGYSFTSKTDTEVIPILCKMYYDKYNDRKPSFISIVENVLSLVEGTYAILIKSREYPDEIIACKKGSPLIIGKAKNGYFFSSDINALVEHTNDLCFVEDYDIVHITPQSMVVYNKELSTDCTIDRDFKKISMESNSVLKGSYEHYMEKEIFEQPISVARTFNDHCKDHVFVMNEIMKYRERINKSSRIIFIACGTSLNACIACRIITEEMLILPVSYENACDFFERGGYIKPSDTCIFVSQSGETADTLQALRYVKGKYAFCIGVTNSYGSSLSREADVCLYLNAGSEIGVGSTKAYTSQIILISILACVLKWNSGIHTSDI